MDFIFSSFERRNSVHFLDIRMVGLAPKFLKSVSCCIQMAVSIQASSLLTTRQRFCLWPEDGYYPGESATEIVLLHGTFVIYSAIIYKLQECHGAALSSEDEYRKKLLLSINHYPNTSIMAMSRISHLD